MADPLIDDVRLPEELREPRSAGPASLPPIAQPAGNTAPSATDDRRRVQRVQAAALVILATAAVLCLMYLAKLVLVVVLTAVLMAFVLAPVVDGLANFRIPRSLGAFLAVALLVITVATVSYLSYARALDFLSQMPEYRTKIAAHRQRNQACRRSGSTRPPTR